MVGSAQNRHESRRLLKELLQASFARLDCRPRSSLFGRLEDGYQNTLDLSCLVAKWAVAEREVGIFDVAVPGDGMKLVFEGQGFARKNAGIDGLVDLPDLRPAILGRLTQTRRVLVSHQFAVGIVVDLNQIVSPENDHGISAP